MAKTADDYHRGEMEIHEQANTYHAFIAMFKWGSLAIAVTVLFFSMWFAAGAGFLGSAAASVVVLVAGIAILREKRKPGH